MHMLTRHLLQLSATCTRNGNREIESRFITYELTAATSRPSKSRNSQRCSGCRPAGRPPQILTPLRATTTRTVKRNKPQAHDDGTRAPRAEERAAARPCRHARTSRGARPLGPFPRDAAGCRHCYSSVCSLSRHHVIRRLSFTSLHSLELQISALHCVQFDRSISIYIYRTSASY